MGLRTGSLVVDLYSPEDHAATSRVLSWQNDLGRCSSARLVPLGPLFRASDFVVVQITPLAHLPGDWVLGQALLAINGTQMGVQPVHFRFGDQADPVATGVFTAEVPFFGQDGGAVRYEAWWVTIRGNGSELRP
jgi:hypothetical protein